MKPNLFEISTKELTQDGFITWFLQWADPSNKQYNEKLNQCATEFINYLIMEQYKEKIEIVKVGAARQWKNVDVYADINEKYFLIIEDKTYTEEHSNQLEKYKNRALDWCEKENRKLICVYLKTISEAKTSLQAIKKKGFIIIGRRELISLFSKYDIDNDIFEDFVLKIKHLEEAENAFEKKVIKDWCENWDSWRGFYNYLDNNTTLDMSGEGCGWNYVPNPSGGFLGFWWHFRTWKEYCVYLQIEQGKLCFKIEVSENQKEVRNEWYDILFNKSLEKGIKEIKKPSRFGTGKWMTVAVVERKDWLGDDNEKIDNKVVERLKEYERFLDYCLE